MPLHRTGSFSNAPLRGEANRASRDSGVELYSWGFSSQIANCWPYLIWEHLKSSKWHRSAHRLQGEVNYMPGARDRVIAGFQNALQSDHTSQLYFFFFSPQNRANKLLSVTNKKLRLSPILMASEAVTLRNKSQDNHRIRSNGTAAILNIYVCCS